MVGVDSVDEIDGPTKNIEIKIKKINLISHHLSYSYSPKC